MQYYNRQLGQHLRYLQSVGSCTSHLFYCKHPGPQPISSCCATHQTQSSCTQPYPYYCHVNHRKIHWGFDFPIPRSAKWKPAYSVPKNFPQPNEPHTTVEGVTLPISWPQGPNATPGGEFPEIYQRLIDMGAHLGHTDHNKEMSPYLMGRRDDVYIINPRHTLVSLVTALEAVKQVVESGGTLLVINTNHDLRSVVQAGEKYYYYINSERKFDVPIGQRLEAYQHIKKFTMYDELFSQLQTKKKILPLQYVKFKEWYRGLVKRNLVQDEYVDEQGNVEQVLKRVWRQPTLLPVGVEQIHNSPMQVSVSKFVQKTQLEEDPLAAAMGDQVATPGHLGDRFHGHDITRYKDKSAVTSDLKPQWAKRKPKLRHSIIFDQVQLIIHVSPDLNWSNVRHTTQYKVPSIGLCDSDSRVDSFTYPVFCNNDSQRLVHMFLDKVVRICQKYGKSSKEQFMESVVQKSIDKASSQKKKPLI